MVLAVDPNAAFAAFFKIESDTCDLVILSKRLLLHLKLLEQLFEKSPVEYHPSQRPIEDDYDESLKIQESNLLPELHSILYKYHLQNQLC